MTLDEIVISVRAWYICEVIYGLISGLVRTSIALLVLRIAVKKYHCWIVKANIFLIWTASLSFFFLTALQCTPIEHYWTKFYGSKGECLLLGKVVPYATIIHSVVSCISDWCLGLLPIAILWTVQLSRRKKIGILLLLSTGMM